MDVWDPNLEGYGPGRGYYPKSAEQWAADREATAAHIARAEAVRPAIAGHVLADAGELAPYDTCEACGQPVEIRDFGRLVTIVGGNRECYGKRP